jgi:hypothetical protein
MFRYRTVGQPRQLLCKTLQLFGGQHSLHGELGQHRLIHPVLSAVVVKLPARHRRPVQEDDRGT